MPRETAATEAPMEAVETLPEQANIEGIDIDAEDALAGASVTTTSCFGGGGGRRMSQED